jgi:hypothetical protein
MGIIFMLIATARITRARGTTAAIIDNKGEAGTTRFSRTYNEQQQQQQQQQRQHRRLSPRNNGFFFTPRTTAWSIDVM